MMNLNNTQKKILDYLKSEKRGKIYQWKSTTQIAKNIPSVSKATILRNLKILAKEFYVKLSMKGKPYRWKFWPPKKIDWIDPRIKFGRGFSFGGTRVKKGNKWLFDGIVKYKGSDHSTFIIKAKNRQELIDELKNRYL